MADSLFNPIFSSINASGGGALTSIGSTAVSGLTNRVDSKVTQVERSLLAPLNNNKITAPIVGQLLGQLTGGMSGGALKQARGRPDPIFGWNFDAFLDKVGVDTAYIEEVSVPYYHFDRLPHYRGGKNYYFPGDFDLSQFAVQFYEDRLLTTTQAMIAWRSRIRNKNNTVNMPSGPNGYKRTMRVAIKDQHFDIVGRALLYGCWPISWDPIKFSSASAERVIMSVEFSADDVEFKFGPATGSVDVGPLKDFRAAAGAAMGGAASLVGSMTGSADPGSNTGSFTRMDRQISSGVDFQTRGDN